MSYILHIDGDAFFASCEISRRPDLKGKPVVVGEERGIACALTYEAKALGVYRGMPIFKIRQEFPSVIVLSSHFELYEEYRQNLLAILKEYLPIVEPYSIDECFAILPAIPENKIREFVQELKNKVQNALGITYSFGIAKTKTLAKVASKKDKPDGCTILISDKSIRDALHDTPAGAIWGIGRQTSAALLAYNIKTAEDFINTPIEILKSRMNEPAIETWHELRGEKIFEVREAREDQKSVQATRSFQPFTTDKEKLFSEISRNVETACIELRAMNLVTNAVHAFYRHADGAKQRQSAGTLLPFYTDDPKIILKEIEKILSMIYSPNVRYRSTGVTLLNLKKENQVQDDLFGYQGTHNTQKSHLKAVDGINRKFGAWTIMHASSLMSVTKRREENILRDKKDAYEYGLPLPYMGEVF